MASRRCEHFTALGAPVDPDVKRSTISEDGSGSSSGSLEEIAGEFRQLFPRERSSTTRIRSASTPVSSAASVRRPASSVTISWQSVCVMSRASSPPRRVGLMPTTVAPASAAPPSQKRYSGPFSSRTPMWKGPGRRSARATDARRALSATTSAHDHESSPNSRPRWSSSARSASSSATVSGVEATRPRCSKMGSMTTTVDDLFLPEPEPREVRYTVISVDDHLVEPADMFEGRLPSDLQGRAPKIIVDEWGHEVWEFDGQIYSQVGMNAVAGRRPETVKIEPFRFDQMRRGCWDIDARIRDMDINGVWASLNFPSMITGFCGRVFSQCSDPELGLAVTKAWNNWLFDEWYSPHPERIIPMGITWLSDPDIGAAEIRRNAARGFRSVTLPERPHRIDLPSIFTDYWEPIIRACAETDTVISLHVGSSGMSEDRKSV